MMNQSRLVDTHMHFWDITEPGLSYDWLAPESVHPILGDINAIKSVRYDIDALHAESRFSGVTAAVHVQAAVGTPDPVLETEWLTRMAEGARLPFVIVAGTDLSADDVEHQLARHSKSPLLRGIRDYGREDFLSDPAFRRGVGKLANFGLLLDLDCPWEDMPIARELALEQTQTTIVLEHFGYPRDTINAEYFEHWRSGISTLADAPNVYCKISGVGMNRAGWTIEGLAPWFEHTIESFGPERCMFGSNWPVDRLWGSYDAYANAFRKLISEHTETDQKLMLHGNAEQVYGLAELADS